VSRIDLLKVAYGANILTLLPTVRTMLFGGGTVRVFEDRVAESVGLRVMVGSLWVAILLASIAGFAWPRFFAPVLLIQTVYEALWLALFIVPLARRSGRAETSPIVILLTRPWPLVQQQPGVRLIVRPTSSPAGPTAVAPSQEGLPPPSRAAPFASRHVSLTR
jgi:hypothetical protein